MPSAERVLGPAITPATVISVQIPLGSQDVSDDAATQAVGATRVQADVSKSSSAPLRFATDTLYPPGTAQTSY
jgi:hypothetical protein